MIIFFSLEFYYSPPLANQFKAFHLLYTMSSHMYHGQAKMDVATTRMSHFLADSVLASSWGHEPAVRARTIKYRDTPAFDAYSWDRPYLPTIPDEFPNFPKEVVQARPQLMQRIQKAEKRIDRLMEMVPKPLPRPASKKTDEVREAESATISPFSLPSIPSPLADTANKSLGTNILYLTAYLCLTHIYTLTN